MIHQLENDIPFVSCGPVIVRSSCAQGETAPPTHHVGHLLGAARRRVTTAYLDKTHSKTSSPRARLRLSAHIRSNHKSYGWKILRKNRGRGTLYSATLKSKIATVVTAIGLPLSSRGL